MRIFQAREGERIEQAMGEQWWLGVRQLMPKYHLYLLLKPKLKGWRLEVSVSLRIPLLKLFHESLKSFFSK